MRLPTEAEVSAAERETDITFPADLRQFLLEASDVFVGVLEPITVTDPDFPSHFATVLEDARTCGVSPDLIPICEDNTDFYCLAQTGEIRFWSHNGPTDETWPNLATWIKSVWIDQN